MATAKTTTALNVKQKLAKARLEFLNQNVKKSGVNRALEFTYFELVDIIPVATKIFADIGLITVTNFDGDKATMTVYNADNAEEEGLTFTAPYREVEPIVSNSGKQVTNSLQALGSSITYLRRYLYMMLLDIVEQDNVDATLGATTISTEQSKPKAPATPAERKAAKEELTAENTAASPEQIEELKTLCKTMITKDESMNDFVQEIALKTKGFTEITATACTELNANLAQIVKEIESRGNNNG